MNAFWWMVQLASTAIMTAWSLAAWGRLIFREFIHRPAPKLFTWIRFKMNPLIPPAVIVSALTGHANDPSPRWDRTTLFLAVWNLAGWAFLTWMDRDRDDDDDDDDDAWRKRAKRAAGRVRALAHKLVVEPAGQPA